MNSIREALRETVYDFLAEDERFYGKMDGTESITAVPERLINELETYINKVREEVLEEFITTLGNSYLGENKLDKTLALNDILKFYFKYSQSIKEQDKEK